MNQDYGIVELGQNTEKYPRDLKRVTVNQTPEKGH